MFVVLGWVLVGAAVAAATGARAAPTPDPGFDAATRAAALNELAAPELPRRIAAVIRLGMVGAPQDLERIAALLGLETTGAGRAGEGPGSGGGGPGVRLGPARGPSREQQDLRTAAARALVGAGHVATTAHFTERAAAARAGDRLEALVLLREAPTLTPAARRAAERALADSDPALRVAALELLTVHPHRDSVPMVAGVLADGNHEVRLAALRLLGLSGDGRALLPLLDRVDVADRGERTAVIDAIGAVGPAPPLDAGPALMRQLGDTSEDVRRAAIDALGRHRHAPAVPMLRTVAGQPARELLARRAVMALGAIGDPAAVRALVELLREADPMEEVGLALRQVGTAAVASTAAALTDGFSSSARLAAETLAAIGDRSATAALAGAVRTRTMVAIPAARALGVLRDPAAVPALLAALDDARSAAAPGVRQACLRALAAIGDARAIRAVERTRDADADVRAAALDLAAVLRGGLSRQGLTTALRDADVAVQTAAVNAARALPGLADNAVLIELIARPTAGPGAEAAQRVAVDAADLLESRITAGDRARVTQALAGAPLPRRRLLARALEVLAPRPGPWVRLRLRATDGTPIAHRRLAVVAASDRRVGAANGAANTATTKTDAETDAEGEVLLTALPGAGPYRVSVEDAAQAARTEAMLSGKSPAMTPELPRERDAQVPAHP